MYDLYIYIRSIIIYNTLICIHMLSCLHTHTSAVFFTQIQQCMEPLSPHDSLCLVSGTLVTKKANRWNAFLILAKGLGIHCEFFFWLLFAKPKIVGLLSLWCFLNLRHPIPKVRCRLFDETKPCRLTKSRRCQCRPRLGELLSQLLLANVVGPSKHGSEKEYGSRRWMWKYHHYWLYITTYGQSNMTHHLGETPWSFFNLTFPQQRWNSRRINGRPKRGLGDDKVHGFWR